MDDADKAAFQRFFDHCHGTALRSGWWDNPEDTFTTKLLLATGELAGEAAEEWRSHGLDPAYFLYYGPDGKPEGIAAEFVDCYVRLADIAGRFGLPLVEAMEAKLRYNSTRPYRHGKLA